MLSNRTVLLHHLKQGAKQVAAVKVRSFLFRCRSIQLQKLRLLLLCLLLHTTAEQVREKAEDAAAQGTAMSLTSSSAGVSPTINELTKIMKLL